MEFQLCFHGARVSQNENPNLNPQPTVLAAAAFIGGSLITTATLASAHQYGNKDRNNNLTSGYRYKPPSYSRGSATYDNKPQHVYRYIHLHIDNIRPPRLICKGSSLESIQVTISNTF